MHSYTFFIFVFCFSCASRILNESDSLSFCYLRLLVGTPGVLLAALGRFLVALGRSWALLGRSWALLGRSWAALGPLLGDLRRSRRASCVQLGSKMAAEAMFAQKREFTKSIGKRKEKPRF